jgi:hypothetical protein
VDRAAGRLFNYTQRPSGGSKAAQAAHASRRKTVQDRPAVGNKSYERNDDYQHAEHYREPRDKVPLRRGTRFLSRRAGRRLETASAAVAEDRRFEGNYTCAAASRLRWCALARAKLIARNSPFFPAISRFFDLAGHHFAHSCVVWRHLFARGTRENRPNSTFLVRNKEFCTNAQSAAASGRRCLFASPYAAIVCDTPNFNKHTTHSWGWRRNVFRRRP